MAKRTKVPRASIACTILDDPDFIGLMQDDSGRQAFALFCAMLAAAKAQDNGGRFEQASVIVAVMVRWPLHEFNVALKDLAGRTNWVTVTTTITIRSFRKWNSWGGKRDSSGAPSGNQNARKIQSENNQDAPKIQPSMHVPVSVSVSDSVTDSKDKDPSVSDKPKRVEYPQDFEDFWQHVPSDKKTGKGAAYKVWQRMNAEDRAKAIDRMEWTNGCFHALDPDKQRIQFLKDPQGWLSGRKFEDSDSAVELVARGR